MPSAFVSRESRARKDGIGRANPDYSDPGLV